MLLAFVVGVAGRETSATLVLAAARRGMGGGGPDGGMAMAGDVVREGAVVAAATAGVAGVVGRESGSGVLEGVDDRSGCTDWRCAPRMGERGVGGGSESVAAGAGVDGAGGSSEGVVVDTDPSGSSAVSGEGTGVFSLLSCLFGSGGGGPADGGFEESIGGSRGGTLLGSGIGGSVDEAFFALSLSLSLQLAAFSPMALAIPQRLLFLGGRGGFSPPVFFSTWTVGGGGSGSGGGGGGGASSSSQTFSTIPVRTNAQRVQVDRRRLRHQPDMQSGYIVVGWLVVGIPPVCGLPLEIGEE